MLTEMIKEQEIKSKLHSFIKNSWQEKKNPAASSLHLPIEDKISQLKSSFWGKHSVFPWSAEMAQSSLFDSKYSLSWFENSLFG